MRHFDINKYTHSRQAATPSTPQSPISAELVLFSADQQEMETSERAAETGDNTPKFKAYLMQNRFPKPIQKHVHRKLIHMDRLLQAVKTPSKQLSGKETRRMSELTKSQLSAYYNVLNQSSNKKKRLHDEERHIQSELTRKGIEVEDPVLDVKKVFALPVRYKRRKHETNKESATDSLSDFSKNTLSCADLTEENKEDFVKLEDISPFSAVEVNENAEPCFSCDEEVMRPTKFNEPELLFREIQNIQALQIQECIGSKENGTNFDNCFEVDKENGQAMLGDLSEFEDLSDTAHAPYVAPPFARVFSE